MKATIELTRDEFNALWRVYYYAATTPGLTKEDDYRPLAKVLDALASDENYRGRYNPPLTPPPHA